MTSTTHIASAERTLTELDHARLSHLVQRQAGSPDWAELLLDAHLVPSRQVAPDVVTMYSQVLLRDPATEQRSTVALTYPADAEPSAGFVSVLSPLGRALLGLPVGTIASWATPTGEHRQAEVVALLFQPEASGDYTL